MTASSRPPSRVHGSPHGHGHARAPELRVLLSNVAYGRRLSGSLGDQVLRAYRHVYTRSAVRRTVVEDVRRLVETTRPDVAGFLEVDRRSARGAAADRLLSALSETHPHGDLANKYFRSTRSALVPLLGGNCNAFCATRPLPFERVYLKAGVKKLVHRVGLADDLTLFFTHLSLRASVRARQIREIAELVRATPGEVVVMGDFNVFDGLREIEPLLGESDLVLLNDHARPTHRFHRTERVLDLCFCSPALRGRAALDVIDQPWSDHAALLLRLDAPARLTEPGAHRALHRAP